MDRSCELRRMTWVVDMLTIRPYDVVIRRLEQDPDLPMIDLPLAGRWRKLRADEPIVFHDKIEFGTINELARGDEASEREIFIFGGRVEPYPPYLDDEAVAVERRSLASFGKRAVSV